MDATHATVESAPERAATAIAAQVMTAAKLPARGVPIALQDVTHASAPWTPARNPAKNARTVESLNLVVTPASAENAHETAATVIAAPRTPVVKLPVKAARTVPRGASLASAP